MAFVQSKDVLYLLISSSRGDATVRLIKSYVIPCRTRARIGTAGKTTIIKGMVVVSGARATYKYTEGDPIRKSKSKVKSGIFLQDASFS